MVSGGAHAAVPFWAGACRVRGAGVAVASGTGPGGAGEAVPAGVGGREPFPAGRAGVRGGGALPAAGVDHEHVGLLGRRREVLFGPDHDGVEHRQGVLALGGEDVLLAGAAAVVVGPAG